MIHLRCNRIKVLIKFVGNYSPFNYAAPIYNKLGLYGFLVFPTQQIEKLRLTYIKAGDKYYLQKQGIGTGSHSSGAYAEIIVDYTYNIAAEKSTHKPEFLSTYVDDAWLLWKSSAENFEEFKANLNSVWAYVNFTSELQEDRKLIFLDLTIELKENNEISFTHYQKPTASGRYLHYDSHCSLVTKTNIIRSETRRIVDSSQLQIQG